MAAVVFDEFHERSVDADLALALCREAQQVLRPDPYPYPYPYPYP